MGEETEKEQQSPKLEVRIFLCCDTLHYAQRVRYRYKNKKDKNYKTNLKRSYLVQLMLRLEERAPPVLLGERHTVPYIGDCM